MPSPLFNHFLVVYSSKTQAKEQPGNWGKSRSHKSQVLPVSYLIRQRGPETQPVEHRLYSKSQHPPRKEQVDSGPPLLEKDEYSQPPTKKGSSK